MTRSASACPRHSSSAERSFSAAWPGAFAASAATCDQLLEPARIQLTSASRRLYAPGRVITTGRQPRVSDLRNRETYT